jgi:hypothetical protein
MYIEIFAALLKRPHVTSIFHVLVVVYRPWMNKSGMNHRTLGSNRVLGCLGLTESAAKKCSVLHHGQRDRRHSNRKSLHSRVLLQDGPESCKRRWIMSNRDFKPLLKPEASSQSGIEAHGNLPGMQFRGQGFMSRASGFTTKNT